VFSIAVRMALCTECSPAVQEVPIIVADSDPGPGAFLTSASGIRDG
jgi:hypothetical protein